MRKIDSSKFVAKVLACDLNKKDICGGENWKSIS